MTELGNSSEALSGVVMGKMAGSALAGQGEAESVTSIAAKIDGGALVSRVLQSQGVKYLMIEFPVLEPERLRSGMRGSKNDQSYIRFKCVGATS